MLPRLIEFVAVGSPAVQAAVMRDGALIVDEVPNPTPGPGEVLVRTLACGICGSDLHALRHGEQLVEATTEARDAVPSSPIALEVMDLRRDVVMGHEFCAEVVELGEGASARRAGDVVVSVPMVMSAAGDLHQVGYSNEYPGGYGEAMVLNDALCLPVPNGLDFRRAALTEPMAVGHHAVVRAGISQGDSALVLGCGPVGLAVVAALQAEGIDPVVAADFSPTRRSLALQLGAHEVVDPNDEPAIDAWRRTAPSAPLVIFEAIGVPGIIDDAMAAAPPRTRICVVGVCMEPDTIRPLRGIARELDVRFSFAYDPAEFATTLQRIADGTLDVTPLITGEVGVDGVPAAFDALADPEAHAKILVIPNR